MTSAQPPTWSLCWRELYRMSLDHLNQCSLLEGAAGGCFLGVCSDGGCDDAFGLPSLAVILSDTEATQLGCGPQD